MMNNKDLKVSVSALDTQVRAGVPLSYVTQRMQTLQRKYAEKWSEISNRISQGELLSHNLQDFFPQQYIEAIKTGEYSGNLEKVLSKVKQNVERSEYIKKTINKLAYPLILILIGFLIRTPQSLRRGQIYKTPMRAIFGRILKNTPRQRIQTGRGLPEIRFRNLLH